MKPEAQEPEYEEVCRQATVQIAQAVDATSAHMYDWDPVAGLVSVVAEYHSPAATPREHRDELGVTYDLNEFPATLRHLAEKQVYIVRADSANADMVDRAQLAAVDGKTAIKIPMVAHEAVVGFIELCESRRAREWTDREIQLCQTLANHAAVTVENARLQKLHRRQSALLALLHEVTWRTSQALNSDQVTQIIVDAIARSFEDTTVDVMLLDETGRTLVMRGAAGAYLSLIPPDYRQSIEQGIVGYVARTGRSYLSNNVRQDPYYLGLEGLPRGSELAVPVQRAGKTIGTLNIESRTLGAFSAADVTTMEILAGQLATAMENARLYAQARQRLNELALLHEIASASATAGDVDTLLTRATQVIAANLYSDNFGFFLVDQAAGLLRAHHSYQGVPSPALQMTIPLGQGITGHVATSGTPLVVADAPADPRYISFARGIRSEMAAPLRVGGRIFGVLNIESRQPAAYSADDLRLLVTVAEQLAAAIERAQAQERAARAAVRLSVVNEIGRKAAATLDALRLLQETAEALHHHLKYDYALTALVDQAGGTLLPVGYAGGRRPLRFSRPIRLDRQAGLLGQAVLDGQAIYVPDTGRDPRYVAAVPDARSALCVPICQPAETVIGLLNMESRQLAAFDPDDIEAIKTLAGQLAVTLTNARLYEETQRRLRELGGLYELSQAFSLITDASQLYGQLTGRVAQLLGVEQCGIVLYDPRSNTVAMQSPAYGLRPEQVARYRWVMPRDPPAWMQSGQTLISNDPQHDMQDNPRISRELARELGERNLLSVPLLIGERCLGMVRVANKVDGSPFTSDDVRLLTIFAGQAAIAIENARLLAASRQRAERLAALQRVGGVLAASLELRPLVEALYHVLTPLFNAETLAIYMLDADALARAGEQHLRCEWVDHGIYRPPLELDLASPNLGAYVTRTGQPLVVADLAGECDARPACGVTIGAPSRSWLGVPLFLHEQASGALTLQAYAPNLFGEEELWLLGQVAPQVTLALQNIHFYQQAQHHSAGLAALQRVSTRLGSGLDRTEVMYAVVEGAQAMIGATDVRIFDYNASGDRLTPAVSRTHYRRRAEFDVPPHPDGITARAARSGQPVIVNAPTQHPLYAAEAAHWALNAIASVPIKRGDRTLAVLNVAFAEQPHQFTDDEVRVLTLLADQAALALENATLAESERQQRAVAETLREMSAIVSATLDLDEVLHRMLDQIRRVVEYDQASVGLITDGRLTIRARSGFPDTGDKLDWAVDSLPLARQIVATAQPVILADMQDPAAFPADILNSVGAHKVGATMGLPIVGQGQVIGIIYLDSFEPNAFTLDHARQIQAFTHHAAMAILNAQLYQALSDRQTAGASNE